MSEMKSLAKDTAIYGLSSIIGKFLNYLLVPLYTYVLARTDDYGIVTNLYAWTALLLVILTYGMETGFFRFANREDYDAKSVYKTAFFTLLGTSSAFALMILLFQQPIATALGYPDHSEFIAMMFATVAVDAFACIPFAYLRYQKRPIAFATLKLLFVVLNIGFNLLFLVVLGKNDVYYVFLSNILATFIQTACLLPMTLPKGGRFDGKVLKEMLKYSLPLLVLGVAGIMNQTLDRILFQRCASTTRYLRGVLQGSNGNDDVHAGFPIRVRAVCFCEAQRQAIRRSVRRCDEVLYHLLVPDPIRRDFLFGHLPVHRFECLLGGSENRAGSAVDVRLPRGVFQPLVLV